MRPRKKRKSSLGVAFGIIFALIALVYMFHYLSNSFVDNGPLPVKTNTDANIAENQQVEQITQDKYFIGKIIDYSKGILKEAKVEGLSYYFVFEGENGEKFYLFSKQEDLNKFLGRNVIIKGKIIDFADTIPVVELIEIYSPDLNNKEFNSYIYEFLSQGLYFDFSSNTGYYAYKDEGGKIVVAYRLTGDLNMDIISGNDLSDVMLSGNKQNIEKILVANGFFCVEKGDFFKNCKAQEKFAKAAYSDSFVSVNGIKFFKVPESIQWFGTDENYIWGYYFSPKDDDSLINMSDYIYPVTTGYLKQKILPLIDEICIQDGAKLAIIKDVKIFKQGAGFVADVFGKDEQGNNYKCKLRLDLLDDMVKVDFQDMKIINQNMAEDSNIVSTQQLNQDLGNQTEEIEEDVKSFTGLVAKFRAGFVLYIPYKKLFYSQVDLDSKDLGINGLDCDIQVSIADKMENLVLDPKIKIYRCKSALDLENLAKHFNQDVVKQADGYYFIFKVLDPEWKDIAEQIKVVVE